ncbi:hypothetical protein QBC45DRAFT_318907, partial [Copromyces sp. CBS 386.78]
RKFVTIIKAISIVSRYIPPFIILLSIKISLNYINNRLNNDITIVTLPNSYIDD